MTQIDELNKYKLDLKIEKLKKVLLFVEHDINNILNMINDSIVNFNQSGDLKYKEEENKFRKELELTRIKYNRLEMIIKNYEIQSKMLVTSELLKDDEIILINNTESIEGKYNIYKVDDQNKVGFITYSPNEYETEIGSIGYSVLPPFRGNNYAYKSLKLLTSYLSSKGVEKASISAEKDNVSSIRIMEKFSSDVPSVKDLKFKKIKKYRYKIKNI